MPPFSEDAFRQAIQSSRIIWRKHVTIRLLERNIARQDVLRCLLEGECIHSYPEDTPFPSALFFIMMQEQPLHVVAAFDAAQEEAFIITAYIPSSSIFELDYKTRKTS
ncbi:MAG: DUF4258 domain-containing protein [Candidatus Kapaibacterium sp.]|nr:MAG: DUF4258 domain-containing protein [Candidatus Kapabacteria bacterium]